jgi:alpha-N-arabinofuranosidase
VNPDIQNQQETEIGIRGAKPSNIQVTVLTSSDVHAHNTFQEPHALEPSQKGVSAQSPFVVPFAPASVTRLEFDLS